MNILSPGSDFDTYNVGSTGFAQVGQPDYDERAEFEGKFLLKRIPELVGKVPPNYCALKWKAFPYEIGAIQLGNYQTVYYHEVCLFVDCNDPRHMKYLNKCEAVDWDKLEAELHHAWLQEHVPETPEDIDHLINPE